MLGNVAIVLTVLVVLCFLCWNALCSAWANLRGKSMQKPAIQRGVTLLIPCRHLKARRWTILQIVVERPAPSPH